MSRHFTILLVPLMLLSLTACASSTLPVIEREHLPVAPANFGKALVLPEATKGKSLKVFVLENRAVAIEANHRLENDAAFYQDVNRAFSLKD